jgi:hypothetical protein
MGAFSTKTEPFQDCSPKKKRKRYASTQRSVTPPPITELLPGAAETASTVTAYQRRRQRVQELKARNPNLDFKLPTHQGPTIGYLTISGKQVQCSNSQAHDAVWDAENNCVDPNVGEVLQLMCERTLKTSRGGVCVTLHKGPETFNFVSHHPHAPPAVRVSVQMLTESNSAEV